MVLQFLGVGMTTIIIHIHLGDIILATTIMVITEVLTDTMAIMEIIMETLITIIITTILTIIETEVM